MLSAFYDKRPIPAQNRHLQADKRTTHNSDRTKDHTQGFTAYVYINAAAKQLSTRRKEEMIGELRPSRLYCHLWYQYHNHPEISPMYFVRNEFLRSIDGAMYSTYLLVCPVPISVHDKPSHVSITVGRCDEVMTYLEVNNLSTQQEQEFGICTAVGFGRLVPEHIVEWMEFQLLLGVTEVNIYDNNMRGLKKLFKHYTNAGVLRVHPMTSPLPTDVIRAIRLASQVVLNHCMMSNMYRYRYVIIVDFDEIMWPNEPGNYSQILDMVNNKQNVSKPWKSYTFHNVYHVLSYPQDNSYPSYLRTMTHRHHDDPTPVPKKSKSITDPRLCIMVFHHHCIISTNQDKPWTIEVSPDIAASHHYRQCPHESGCDTVPQTRNDNVLKYQQLLQTRVQRALRDIGSL